MTITIANESEKENAGIVRLYVFASRDRITAQLLANWDLVLDISLSNIEAKAAPTI